MKLLKRWKIRILLLLAVIGPGFITANVDNDAGGILAHSFVRAHFSRISSRHTVGSVTRSISDCASPGFFPATIAS
jgi:hypothetical protein